MSLLNDLTEMQEAPLRRSGGLECSIGRVLRSLPKDEAAKLAEVIDNSDVYGTWIANLLTKHGFKVNGAQVQHHRRRVHSGGCKCPVGDA